MKTVYLDQNHWIELAKSAYGPGVNPVVDGVREQLLEAQGKEAACFPLSLGHYFETNKPRDSGRRERLARFMLQLSAGVTIADPSSVLDHELDVAIRSKFDIDSSGAKPFRFLGRGLAHAIGRDFPVTLNDPPGASEEQLKLKAGLEAVAQSCAEFWSLSGTFPTSLTSPLSNLAPDRAFRDGLQRWRGAASKVTSRELDGLIRTITLGDIKEPLARVLDRHAITADRFRAVDWQLFLDDLPSRKADMHLRKEWARNASLVPKESDLNDWAYLGIAVCYCDVVVTERQMKNLFDRGFRSKAVIVDNLAALPELL